MQVNQIGPKKLNQVKKLGLPGSAAVIGKKYGGGGDGYA